MMCPVFNIMYKVTNTVALAANVILGASSIVLYSVIYGIFASTSKSGYPNILASVSPTVSQMLFPLGITMIIGLVSYGIYRLMVERGLKYPSYQ